MLEQTGLARARATTRSATLSGGNQQRVNIAIGLLSRARRCCCSTSRAPRSTRASASGSGSSSLGSPSAGTTVIYSTHNIQEAERYARPAAGARRRRAAVRRARRASCDAAVARRDRDARLRGGLRRLPAAAGPLTVRWLLLKDLQILRRSPLLAALLVALPGRDRGAGRLRALARARRSRGSRSSTRCRRASQRAGSAARGSTSSTPASAALQRDRRACASSRGGGDREGQVDGDVLGALILPPDIAQKLELRPRVRRASKVIVNRGPGQGAARRRHDQVRCSQDANLRAPEQLTQVALQLPRPDPQRRRLQLPRPAVDILGLARASEILSASQAQLPPAPQRPARPGRRVRQPRQREPRPRGRRARRRSRQPIKVDKQIVDGGAPPLDTFAVAVAATHHADVRHACCWSPARWRSSARRTPSPGSSAGWSSRTACWPRRSSLGGRVRAGRHAADAAGSRCSSARTGAASRSGSSRVARRRAGLRRARARDRRAAREVRAASLLAFMLSLPVAFLALVPSGTVAPGLYRRDPRDLGAVPVQADARRARPAALDPARGALGAPLLHLAAARPSPTALHRARVALRALRLSRRHRLES